MRSFAKAIRRAYLEAQKGRKYVKNVVVNRSANNPAVGLLTASLLG